MTIYTRMICSWDWKGVSQDERKEDKDRERLKKVLLETERKLLILVMALENGVFSKIIREKIAMFEETNFLPRDP